METTTESNPSELLIGGIEQMIEGRLRLEKLKHQEDQASMSFHIDRDNALETVKDGHCQLRDLMQILVPPTPAPPAKPGRVSQLWVLHALESSMCGECGQKVSLLGLAQGGPPGFYICWKCRKVSEVGVGPVPSLP